MAKINPRDYDLVYKTSTTPFFPICFCGRNYSIKYDKLADLKLEPEPVIAIVKNDIVNWYFPKSLPRIARRLMAKFFSSDKIIKIIRSKEKVLSRKLFSLIKKPIGQYFTNGLLNEVGYKAVSNLFKLYTEYGYYVDVTGFLFQLYYIDEYQSLVKKQAGRLKLTEEDYNNLLCLNNLTNYEKFNLAVFWIIKNGINDRSIKSLERKFYWIVHDYLGDIAKVDYLRKYIDKFKKNLAQEKAHIRESRNRIRDINKTLAKLSPKLRHNAEKLHELMWFYNDRKKEVLNQVNIYIRKIISHRFPSFNINKLHKLYQFSPE